ncbi:MAG: VOC family protein [Candidatus Eremiobacteraeota bacterium]|nr:VOC family protein [Candidatus Eremiobacteraeota bacterium]
MPLILSHVDLRVRDRAKAIEFYDALLNVLGATREDGKTFTTWQIPPPDAPADWEATEWFGITEDPAMTPGPVRVAFDAPSRGTVDAIATYLPAIGARNIEWDEGIYGGRYYAVFFDDPDGNKLEVCYIGA